MHTPNRLLQRGLDARYLYSHVSTRPATRLFDGEVYVTFRGVYHHVSAQLPGQFMTFWNGVNGEDLA